jgi:hypothetical protein
LSGKYTACGRFECKNGAVAGHIYELKWKKSHLTAILSEGIALEKYTNIPFCYFFNKNNRFFRMI